MQALLGDPESGCLDLKSHHLAFAIAKKTLDENRFKHAQKTTNCQPLNFKFGDRVYFKNKQPGKWDLKWNAGYRIVCIEHNGHYLHIENQATGKTRPCNVKIIVYEPPVDLWNVDTKFDRGGKFVNHLANLPPFSYTQIKIIIPITTFPKKTFTHKDHPLSVYSSYGP